MILSPERCLEGRSRDTFGHPKRGEEYYWQPVGRSQDAAKHPTMRRTASPTTKNYLAHNVKSAKLRNSHLIQHILQMRKSWPREKDDLPRTTQRIDGKAMIRNILKPSTSFLPDLKLLTNQRAACYKREEFSGKDCVGQRAQANHTQSSGPILLLPSWITPWRRSQGRF